jgi:hypothetical protein
MPMTEFAVQTPPNEFDHPADASSTAGWQKASLDFRVWRSPAFEASISWAVVHDFGSYFLRRTVWDSGATSKETQLHTIGAPLPEALFKRLDAGLREMVFLPFVEALMMMLDGTAYGLERKWTGGSLKLEWDSPPRGWEALADWRHTAERALDEILPSVPPIQYRVPYFGWSPCRVTNF